MSLFNRGADSGSRADRRLRSERILRHRPLPAWRLRLGVQLISLAIIALGGIRFAVWVGHLEQGRIIGERPAGVEGFLPISALISLRHLFETGEFSCIHPAGLVIFALAVLTSLLLKKAFCSWICPVGTVSEYLSRAGHLVFRRRFRLPPWLDRSLMALKYLLLAFFVHAVFIQMTPRAVALFLDSPYNKVADVKMLYFFSRISATTLIVIGALALLSVVIPYFWCRYLCPYGALLGLVSRLSPMKIVRAPLSCSDCGKCAAVCPSFLDVDRTETVSSLECTGCLECVNSCPAPGALTVGGPAWRRWVMKPAVFAALLVMLFYGGIGLAKMTGNWRSGIPDTEYMQRVREIETPKYNHVRGQVPEYGPQD